MLQRLCYPLLVFLLAGCVAVAVTEVETSRSPQPTACPVATQTGVIPSDRLISVRLGGDGAQDIRLFHFGAPSESGKTSNFVVSAVADDVSVAGDATLLVEFDDLSVTNEDGTATFGGATRIVSIDPSVVREVVRIRNDVTEQWLIGYDGASCPTVGVSADLIVAFPSP